MITLPRGSMRGSGRFSLSGVPKALRNSFGALHRTSSKGKGVKASPPAKKDGSRGA